jgi:hypothetical protein
MGSMDGAGMESTINSGLGSMEATGRGSRIRAGLASSNGAGLAGIGSMEAR